MLSIVYITCNRSEELIKSIMSCEERVTVEHEYVVIDNGSKDDTAQKINEKIADGVPIRYLLQDKNYGVSGGRNIGFREAKGDICYFIDDDATIVSDGMVLDSAYAYLKSNAIILAMGTDCYDTEREIQLVGPPEKGMEKNSCAPIRSFVGCSHFIRKENFPYDYLYPSNLMYGSEELYEGLGVYRADGIVMQYPDLKILHQPSKKNRDDRKIRQRHGHINTYVIKKYYLPTGYAALSSVLFFFRLMHFESMSIKRILDDYREVKRRYDKQYERKMTAKQTTRLISQFGFTRII